MAPTGTGRMAVGTVILVTPARDRSLPIGPGGSDTLGLDLGRGLRAGIDIGGASNVTVVGNRVWDFKGIGITVHGTGAGATLEANAVAYEHDGFPVDAASGWEYGICGDLRAALISRGWSGGSVGLAPVPS